LTEEDDLRPAGMRRQVAYGASDAEAERHARRASSKKAKKDAKRTSVKDRDWVLRKKEAQRRRGDVVVPADSKYTARKRKPKF
jgi:18S rRNA (guanine1575-N7)-methyltransferase